MDESLPELLAELVRRNSVNPALVPDGAGEVEIAGFVLAWLTRHGIPAELDLAAPGRPSVIARVRGSGGGQTLLLNAHLDTVGLAEMPAALTPTIRGGRMYGRGTYDMKAGLAACLLALRDARGMTLRGDVILTAVADEEHASIGTQSVLKKVRADAAIVTEPTGLQLCVAHKGFTWHELTTRGHAAHGSRPDLGQDAIAHMGRVLVELEALGRELTLCSAHPLLGHGSLHASLISGGQELSSYPERCTLHLERRTLPGETPQDVEAELDRLLRRLEADPGFRAEHRLLLTREPLSVPADAPIVGLLSRQAGRVLGQAPAQMGLSFWMDSALLAAAGIPTVVFGPSGAGAHASEEWVDLASAEQCHEILSATIAEFCA
ncbi:M20/M25/M40 family metallo-hydrolase [Deinococcus aerophilus]|uniref:Acetylornithine deacetylase n=1 Tax=Deinococcus aerophilus TaxID=522488 RepID=A0ABQ2H0N6_9DEIO|nr:M20/M25/M40 family metallo-hydrolase [Deinococcus aerophilus]GGM20666.1 acetylornithine deacetylase [Deinococcus aerophilus]